MGSFILWFKRKVSKKKIENNVRIYKDISSLDMKKWPSKKKKNGTLNKQKLQAHIWFFSLKPSVTCSNQILVKSQCLRWLDNKVFYSHFRQGPFSGLFANYAYAVFSKNVISCCNGKFLFCCCSRAWQWSLLSLKDERK